MLLYRVYNGNMDRKKIKTLRLKRRLSQRAFAKLLGVSAATVCKYESGQRNPGGSAKILLQQLMAEM